MKPPMKSNDHLLWPDILKVAAAYAVVVLHSAAPLVVRYNDLGATSWWIGNIYDSLSRWCIPLFVMLSGAFLLDRASGVSLGSFFRRRLRRVALPFVVWSFIYFLWRIHGNKEPLALADFLPLLIAGPIYYHLWFLYLIIGLYLLAPLLSVYLKHADKRNVAYVLVLWLVMGSILPVAESYFKIQTYFSTGTSPSLSQFIGYFILGALLRDLRIRSPEPWRILAFVLLFVLAFVITAYGTYYVTVIKNNGAFDGVFYEYFSPNVVGMTLAVYMLGKSLAVPAAPEHVERKWGPVSAIAAAVPGIYLVHAMLIEVAKDGALGFSFDQTTLQPALGVPAFALGIFLASLLIVLIMKQLPGIKYLVP